MFYIFSATVQVVCEILKVLTILSATTVKRVAVELEDLKP